MDAARKRKVELVDGQPAKEARGNSEAIAAVKVVLREAHLPHTQTLLVIAENHALLSSRVFSDIDPKGYAAGVVAGAERDYDLENSQHVVLFVLPSACGRHNSTSKAYAVNAFMKSKKKLLHAVKSIGILVISSSASHAFAQVAEVSRHFPYFSMKSNERSKGSVTILVDFPGMHHDFLAVQHVVDGIRLCQYLVDSPPNLLNVNRYVAECQQVAVRTSSTISIIRGEQLRDQGFGGIWAVGAASIELPALVILSHLPPEPADTKSICLVGKGIVFDTGGLSVKVGGGMVGMKRDMGGSAAILAAFEAIVKSNACQRPLHAILCIAENSISGMSTRPDDIITMYSKKTVEINNIDAEGRLVLADGCSYAHQHLNPSHIIDMATLTGAQGVSTGKRHGAIYSNDDEVEMKAIVSGKSSGDLVHPMPYCPEFFSREFDSECADMTNSVSDRTNAQVSCAAQFIGNHIESFLDEGGKWLHIDMAYPVHAGERATGYGVALLYDLVKSL